MQIPQKKETLTTKGRRFTGNWPRLFYACVGCGLIISGLVSRGGAETNPPAVIHSILIVQDPEASPIEQRIGKVLKDRISRQASVQMEVSRVRKPGADVYIHLGKVRESGDLHDLCAQHQVRPPGKDKPNPEGYAVKTVVEGKDRVVIAVGADDRGALYAAGEILRRLRFEADQVELPAVDMSTSPGSASAVSPPTRAAP